MLFLLPLEVGGSNQYLQHLISYYYTSPPLHFIIFSLSSWIMNYSLSFTPSLSFSLLFYYYSYVLRRILRRGVRYITEKLNAKPGTFASLVPTVLDVLVSQ